MAAKRLTARERTKRKREQVTKRMTKFLDKKDKEVSNVMHDLEKALSEACEAMYLMDDLRMDMEDFSHAPVDEDEDGNEDVFDFVPKKVERRFDALSDAIEKYDGTSDFFDEVNTLHSKAIGVL